MSEYYRWLVPGGTFFFTVVTYERRPLFADARAVYLLGDVMKEERRGHDFQIIAMVMMPDHLHCVWSLPSGDSDYSRRWKRIKREFTLRWLDAGGADQAVSKSRRARGERGIWQRRFWEHQVEDEVDLEHCCDYIHYNPVKHGHAARPADWPWSTFQKFVKAGQYDPDWGRTLPATLQTEQPMGE